MITPPAPMITAEGMPPEVIAVLQEACDSKKPWNARDVAAAMINAWPNANKAYFAQGPHLMLPLLKAGT
jgi:hypothetical protein